MLNLISTPLFLKAFFWSIFSFLFTFFLPLYGTLIAVCIAVIADTIFGLWKAKKLKGERTSKLMRKGMVPKLIGYQLAVTTLFILDSLVLNQFTMLFIAFPFFLTKLLALVFIFIELISINENWEAVKGKSIITSFREMLKAGKTLRNEIEDAVENKSNPNI